MNDMNEYRNGRNVEDQAVRERIMPIVLTLIV